MEEQRIKEQSVSFTSRVSVPVIKPFIPHQSKLLIDRVSTPSQHPHDFFFFFAKSRALLMRLCNDINGSIRCKWRREPINAHRGAQKNPQRDNNITITKSNVSGSSRTSAPAMCARSSDLSSLRARSHTHTRTRSCCCRFSAQQVWAPSGILAFAETNTGFKRRLQAQRLLMLSPTP